MRQHHQLQNLMKNVASYGKLSIVPKRVVFGDEFEARDTNRRHTYSSKDSIKDLCAFFNIEFFQNVQ